MKICLIGNQNIFIYNFARYYLERHGFDVYLISRDKKNHTAEDFSFIKVYILRSEKLLYKIWRIRSLIKRLKPDIVHNFYLARDALAPCLIYGRQFKYVCSIFGSDIYWETNSKFNRWLKGLILQHCDIITFNSYQMISDLRRLYPWLPPEKIKPIIWGVNFELFNKVDAEAIRKKKQELNIHNETVILSYRGFKPVYNQDIILKAIPLIVNRNDRVKFIFILGHTTSEEVKPLLSLLPEEILKKHVILIEKFLKQEEVTLFLNLADIVVNIPKTDQIAQSVLETMASRAIPVLSNLRVYKDILVDRRNAFFLKELNERELSDCILDIIDNTLSRREQIVRDNNRLVQENYDFGQQIEKVIELYN